MSDFFVTWWTLAHQAPLSIAFSRLEYWSGLPFPSPGDRPNHRSNLSLLHWQLNSLPLSQEGSLEVYCTRELFPLLHLICKEHMYVAMMCFLNLVSWMNSQIFESGLTENMVLLFTALCLVSTYLYDGYSHIFSHITCKTHRNNIGSFSFTGKEVQT